MRIFYHSSKFELNQFINYADLLSDRNNLKHGQTHPQTDTQTESDTLPIYAIESSRLNIGFGIKLLAQK